MNVRYSLSYLRRNSPSHRTESGQSTVEFMLMIPVLFAVLFFVIEMGLYFSAIHYTNYATYTTARARIVGYKNAQSNLSADTVARLILNGSAFRFNTEVEEVSDADGEGVRISLRHWDTNFPFINRLMPNMAFSTTVYLGKNELEYEENLQGSLMCVDNDMGSFACN